MTAILAFFLSPIGRWIGIAAIALAALGANDLYFYNKGKAHVQAKWDAAIQAAVEKGNKARTDAERDVGDAPTDGVRDDFQRND